MMKTFNRATSTSSPWLVTLIVSACFFVAASVAAAGQVQTGGLAVEIVHSDQQKPIYIPGNETVWFSRFRRVAAWQPLAGSPPVQAVQVASKVETADTVILRVSVHLGARQFDDEKTVATFRAREGERIVVEELRQFGVEPVELRVVHARRLAATPPLVENQTHSVRILGVEPIDVSFPSYNVRLRNISGKGIAVIQVFYESENGSRKQSWLQQQHNETLVESGADYELNAFGGNDGQVAPDGYAPDPLRRVIVATVVFTDGSYEGDSLVAASVNAKWRARKMQLARALALVQRALDAPDVDAPAALARFRAQAATLVESVPPGMIEELLPVFAAFGEAARARMSGSFEFELHRLKNDLMVAIGKFEKAHRESPGRITFRQWLVMVKEMYEQWLVRL